MRSNDLIFDDLIKEQHLWKAEITWSNICHLLTKWGCFFRIFISYPISEDNSNGLLKCQLSNKSSCETMLYVPHSTDATFYRNLVRVMKPFWMQSSDRLAKANMGGTHKTQIGRYVKVFSRVLDFFFWDLLQFYIMRDYTVHWVSKHVGHSKNFRIRLIFQKFILTY